MIYDQEFLWLRLFARQEQRRKLETLPSSIEEQGDRAERAIHRLQAMETCPCGYGMLWVKSWTPEI